MPEPLPMPLLWSQEIVQPFQSYWQFLVLVIGDPTVSPAGTWGLVIDWFKVVGLLSLIVWVGSWVLTARKAGAVARPRWLDVAALVALVGVVGAVALHVLQTTGRVHRLVIGRFPIELVVGFASVVVLAAWVETVLWSTILRLGRRGDRVILAGMHLALLLGFVAGAVLSGTHWLGALTLGARYGGTLMGYVALGNVAALLAREVVALRWRRLYAIAWHTVIEANRRMWAPWVVIAVFAVILAFTHWFLRPGQDAEIARQAELGRLFVVALMLICSLLILLMVSVVVPLSLPNDIQQQTIYTVVSKPVRRLELIWGRMLGFMALVTVLLTIFGGASLLYMDRIVGGTIAEVKKAAVKLRSEDRPERARVLEEQADQMETRMSARVPLKGSLIFLDAEGNLSLKGIDVGTELEFRSHIEGGTQAKAVWRYGIVELPRDPELKRPAILQDRRLPVDSILVPGSIEGLANRVEELKVAESNSRKGNDRSSPAGYRAEIRRASDQLAQAKAREATLREKADAEEAKGHPTEAQTLRKEASDLHSPPIELQMTFNIYRTTKGVPGEPVLASIKAINPFSAEPPHSAIFPIHEYYTDKHYLPSSILVGCQGALSIEVLCLSPTQYLGMAESDLFILARDGNFKVNYMKGMFGIWLQAMVLTAIGVWAGTFLSWPVALLTSFFFFLLGQAAFSMLEQFSSQTLLGGGPFESMIRMITHDSQVTELAPTLGVVTAKTLDALVTPIMSRLVYIVPNFSTLDVSNTVSDGFDVDWGLLGQNLLMAVGYALPFSVAGYYILKNREVAA